jgi:hypothetical protein
MIFKIWKDADFALETAHQNKMYSKIFCYSIYEAINSLLIHNTSVKSNYSFYSLLQKKRRYVEIGVVYIMQPIFLVKWVLFYYERCGSEKESAEISILTN